MIRKLAIPTFSFVICAIFVSAPVSALREPAPTNFPVAQCRTADRMIRKQIRFARGRTTAVINDTVRLCTGHEYHLRARAGQSMSVRLVTGRRTSLTLHAPSGQALVDGGNDWSGQLSETGEYVIEIGTDAIARYTLEVTIR